MSEDDRVLNVVVGRQLRASIAKAGSNLRLAARNSGLNYRSLMRYVAGERDLPVPVLLALLHAAGADEVEFMRDLVVALRPDGDQESSSRTSQVERAVRLGVQEGGLSPGRDELEARLRALGVERLAARSIGPVSDQELREVADVVRDIVEGIHTH